MNTFTSCECVDNFLQLFYNIVVNVSLTYSCSFFGHRDFEPNNGLKQELCNLIEKLILEKDCKTFYFGGFGDFDCECYKIVSKLKEKYPYIRRIFCLPDKKHEKERKRPSWIQEYLCEEYVYLDLTYDYWYTRIYYRNCEIIKNSDFVIFYVNTNLNGGANKALNFAKKQKRVL